MKKIKVLSLALVAVMLCALFASCDLLGGKTVLKVGESNISEEIFSAALSQVDMYMQQSYGFSMAEMLDQEMAEGQTGADILKSEAEGILREFESVRAMAKENGVELSSEDKKTIADQKKSQIEADGGRKAFLDKLAESGANEAFYDYVMESQLLYSKVYSELFTGEGKYAPTPEKMAELFGEGYVCVKHVLVMGTEADEDFAEKKAKAEDIAKRAKAGEDFDALIAEFGEDPGMESYKGGYIMDMQGYTPTGSTMVQEFTDASVALAVGGVSDIVKSDHGFHIIKRYPVTAEHFATDVEGFSNQVGSVIFTEELMKVMENITVEKTEAYDNFDVHSIFGADKALGADAEESHEGHDHEATGEEAAEGAEGTVEGDAATAEVPEITLTPAE